MDSDNSNRKTSYFHAQKILDAAADIKAKKSRGVRRERQNDPIYLKTRVCPEKKSTCNQIGSKSNFVLSIYNLEGSYSRELKKDLKRTIKIKGLKKD